MEYIGVSLAFTTAGVLFFVAANRAMVIELRGTADSMGGNSQISKIIGPNNAVPWPPGWNPDTTPVKIDSGNPSSFKQLSDSRNEALAQ